MLVGELIDALAGRNRDDAIVVTHKTLGAFDLERIAFSTDAVVVLRIVTPSQDAAEAAERNERT